jgi:hypothetical protein
MRRLRPGSRGLAASAVLVSVVGVVIACSRYGEEDEPPSTPDASPLDGTPGEDRVESDASSTPDVTPDADAAPPVTCVPQTCSAAGGTCVGQTCTFVCGANACSGRTIACPQNHACRVDCANDACENLQCIGGVSCQIDCKDINSCKQRVSCSSGTCDVRCLVKDACREGVVCDAGVCLVACTGEQSCGKGVAIRAGIHCGITCGGDYTCDDLNAVVSCGSTPDASITCSGAQSCKSARPQCDGGYCEINCVGSGACAADYCCAAKTCVVEAGAGVTNACP